MIDRLELGQNIFELIEFSVDRRLADGQTRRGLYGVNVAKVREVVRLPKINPLASRVEGVSGIFELRGVPIPAINLAIALGDKEAPIRQDQQIIVTEFSRKRAGFIVGSTHRIRRVAWDKVLPPASDRKACISGMTLIENNEFLFILDLERILLEIERLSDFDYNQAASQPSYVPSHTPYSPNSPRMYVGEQQAQHAAPLKASSTQLDVPTVLLIDDSALILKSVKAALEGVGFNVISATDGLAGKNILEESIAEGGGHARVDIIVSDVEMPRMDGLTLTRWVKEHPVLADTPVILHTSLSGNANQDAGYRIGANGYVVKNDLRKLFHLMTEILGSNLGPKIKMIG